MRTFSTLIVAVSGAVLFSHSPGFGQSPVKIGIVSATSGPLAAPGKFQINGFKLAADEINEKGGFEVAGRKYRLELVIYDTRGSTGEGASAMQRLINVDRVPVILGELSSAVAGAQAPIARDYGVPLILTVPTGPTLTRQGNPFLFRVNANTAQLVVALADHIRRQGWSPLSFLAWNNDAGRGGVNEMKELAGGSIKIGYVGYFNVGEVDFSSHITNIRREGARAVMLLMDEEPGSLAIKQIKDAGLNVQLIGTLAMGSARFLQRLDRAQLAGMVQYSAFPPNAPLPRIRNFNERYRVTFNEESHGFAAQSYDGLFVALEAMKRAGTVTDGRKIRDALAQTDHEGVIGRIKFGPDGQAAPPVYITQWCDDGTRRIIYPEPLRAGCGAG